MKLIAKISLGLVLLYVLFWASVAIYFNYAERHKGLLEANLSSVFKREVTIQQVRTAWNGLSPTIQFNGFKVAGDTSHQAAFSFKSLSAKLSPISILRFWPQLTEFAVEQPNLEIVSLPGNQLQIAGIKLNSNRAGGISPKRLISWLLNHKSAVWLNGEIVWRRLNGEQQRYSQVSFVYQRDAENRKISAATITPKGPFAFKAQANGNVLEVEHWDASLEVLGGQGQRLLAPEDLSLVVENGRGSLQLQSLDIQRIRDFLLITGLAEKASWVLDAQLAGRLHDMRFDFSGPLLEISDWSLAAFASQVSFGATNTTPGMSNLAGKVNASAIGGSFEFTAKDAVFDWPRWFDRDIPIEQATGQFDWSLASNGEVEIVLANGVFEDAITKIWDLNATCSVDTKSRNVSNLAQLFKVESVADLSFEGGRVVEQKSRLGKSSGPLYLDAEAKFEVKSLPQVVRYLPNDSRISKFRTWWTAAFLQGTANNGVLSYQGEVSKNAIKVGKALLRGQVNFTDVDLDYGYQRGWPKLLDGKGLATLENELMTIQPTQAWIEDDRVDEAKVTIDSLFHLDRRLDLQASMVTPLPRAMQFLFNGPLLKPEQSDRPMPITAQSGRVAAQVSVSIPLRNVRDARVTGIAKVTEGNFMLPQGVPVTDASAQINFTERSAESNNIKATFLNGIARAKLITTEVAQPPKMKVSATGIAQIKQLQPWLGEHILSWLDGSANWQGAAEIDGSKVQISAVSDLQGVAISAPEPLGKVADQASLFSFSMQTGGGEVQNKLAIEYGSNLRARLEGDLAGANELFDKSMIRLGDEIELSSLLLQPGINFLAEDNQLDLDAWLAAIIDLAQLKTAILAEPDTAFLDAMRTVKIKSTDPLFMSRQFGAMELSAISVDGAYWIGAINGDNINGTLQAEPRADVGRYRFNLSRLHVGEAPQSLTAPDPIDNTLEPKKYPRIELSANSFRLSDKSMGRLALVGAPDGDVWKLSKFELSDQGIRTTATGQWVNSIVADSLTSFDIETTIDEAGGVLDEMDFNGILKRGNGRLTAHTTWRGAPHEFDFARLNGEFDLNISDGELIKVEPGTGKLLGLLNFNAIARRLTLDFRDVFSTGLQFDRMQYTGVLADGEAIMREAYILTPAVFITMQGKLNLDTELIDMELHASPELGGNLTLLSALANPAAGALVFVTQQLFKDQMRSASYKSYRALGTWENFELIEFEDNKSEGAPPQQKTLEPEQLEQELPQGKPSKTNNQAVDESSAVVDNADLRVPENSDKTEIVPENEQPQTAQTP